MTPRIASLSFALFLSLFAFSVSPLALAAQGTVNPLANPAGTVNQPNSPSTQPAPESPTVSLLNPLSGNCTAGQDCLFAFLNSILDLAIRVGTVAIILMLVYIGFLFATSSVNPGNIKQAREYLLWTIIGALVLLGAKAISAGIAATVQAIATGQ